MIKEVILNFINQNNSIAEFRNEASKEYQNGKEVISLFVSKLEETKFSLQLGNDFAELLQLSDDKSICEQYELTDISNLYDNLRKVQETNLDTFIESGYFEFAIMDNSVKAKEVVVAGIEIAKGKIDELNSLLAKIGEELK